MEDKLGMLRAAAATPEVKVADVEWNVSEIGRLCKEVAGECNPALIVLPELAITGYTCGDLFRQKHLIRNAESGLRKLCAETAHLSQLLVVGCPVASGSKLYDAAVVVRGGHILGIAPKSVVTPEESRWFSAPPAEAEEFEFAGQTCRMEAAAVFTEGNVRFGIEIGESLISPKTADAFRKAEVDLVLCPAASCELAGKQERRKSELETASLALEAAYVFSCNGYGESTDDFVWAGSSLIFGNGELLAENERFQNKSSWIAASIDLRRLHQDRLFTIPEKVEDVLNPMPFVPSDPARLAARCDEIFNIQTVGLMSRLEHIRCSKCVIGVSGGLDSTLALLVICEAFDRLGLDRKGIYAVTMPCFGTSDRTHSNAWGLMEKLGVNAMEIRIGDAVLQHFKDIGHDPSAHDLTYENAQARERTQVLMDLGNKVGGIVVGTGDLSEIALGWCTYNGDHMSMYGVNAGVPKTLIRAMVRHLAKGHPCEATLLDIVDTPVSPELVPGQVTEDLLGPYELHDFFLRHFMLGEAPWEILDDALRAFDGVYDEALVKKCLGTFIRRFFSQQFKRACSPCGPKVGTVGLSPRGDWLMPTDASSNLWLKDI